MNPYGKSNTIAKAASLIRGDRLNDFYDICETQKSISTSKLRKFLDELNEGMTLDGIHLSELAKKMENDNG